MTRMTEMIHLPEDMWMRETDIDRPLIYKRKDEKNLLLVTRNISFPVRILIAK
jgi:hypothetical protein